MYGMAMWNWTEKEAARNFGIVLGVGGIMALLTYLTVAFKVGKIIGNGNERKGTIIALSLWLLFHVATFPYNFWPALDHKKTTPPDDSSSQPGNIFAERSTGGCNKTYIWCEYTHQVPMYLYIPAFLICFGCVFSLFNVSMHTLYSKILGPRRQGTMQGVLLFAGSTARTAGPIFVAYLFKTYGPRVMWIIEMIGLSITILAWLILYKRMIPLVTKRIMSSIDVLPSIQRHSRG